MKTEKPTQLTSELPEHIKDIHFKLFELDLLVEKKLNNSKDFYSDYVDIEQDIFRCIGTLNLLQSKINSMAFKQNTKNK